GKIARKALADRGVRAIRLNRSRQTATVTDFSCKTGGKAGVDPLPAQATTPSRRPLAQRHQPWAIGIRILRPTKNRQRQSGFQIQSVKKEQAVGLCLGFIRMRQQVLILVSCSKVM